MVAHIFSFYLELTRCASREVVGRFVVNVSPNGSPSLPRSSLPAADDSVISVFFQFLFIPVAFRAQPDFRERPTDFRRNEFRRGFLEEVPCDFADGARCAVVVVHRAYPTGACGVMKVEAVAPDAGNAFSDASSFTLSMNPQINAAEYLPIVTAPGISQLNVSNLASFSSPSSTPMMVVFLSHRCDRWPR